MGVFIYHPQDKTFEHYFSDKDVYKRQQVHRQNVRWLILLPLQQERPYIFLQIHHIHSALSLIHILSQLCRLHVTQSASKSV